MKRLLFLTILTVLYTGCKKDIPPKDILQIGNYEAWFYGSYTKDGQIYKLDRFQKLSIIGTNNTQIIIAPCLTCESITILQKNREITSGIIMVSDGRATGGPSYPSREVHITGKLEKQQEQYSITGFHQYVYTDVDVENQKISEYIVSGNFEIRPEQASEIIKP